MARIEVQDSCSVAHRATQSKKVSKEDARHMVDEISQNDHSGDDLYSGAFSRMSVDSATATARSSVSPLTGYCQTIKGDDADNKEQDEEQKVAMIAVSH